MAYSEAQKALAREVVKRHGGELSHSALEEIRTLLSLPTLGKTTVWRWLNSSSKNGTKPKPEKKVNREKPLEMPSRAEMELKAEKTLDELFEEVAKTYLKKALDNTEKMNGQQLVTAAAIAFDKMRVAKGLPTEIVSVVGNLLPLLQQAGLNPVEVFVELGNQLAKGKSQVWTQ